MDLQLKVIIYCHSSNKCQTNSCTIRVLKPRIRARRERTDNKQYNKLWKSKNEEKFSINRNGQK